MTALKEAFSCLVHTVGGSGDHFKLEGHAANVPGLDVSVLLLALSTSVWRVYFWDE